MLRRKSLFESTIIAGFALAALSGSAHAQQPASADQPSAAEDDVSDDEEIVITGSRIRTSEFTAPSPVQVLTSEQADLRGLGDSARFLQTASVAAGSSQVDSKISSAFVTEGGPGAQTVGLRGLEAKRTLILINGRRAGPAGTRGGVSSVDLNVIPISAIDRVDILKDGASSIYGSDAVAGVVNLITKKDFAGGELDVFGSKPMEDGGDEYRANASFGKSWDKLRFMVSGDYYKRNEVKVKDRDFFSCAQAYIFDSVTGERKDLIDPFTGQYKCINIPIGQIWAYDFDGVFSGVEISSGVNSFSPDSDPHLLQYDASGQIGVFSPGSIFPTPVDAGDLVSPGDWYLVSRQGNLASSSVRQNNHEFLQNSGVIPELETSTIYLEGSVDLTPSIQAYSEVLLNRRESSLTGWTQFWDFQLTQDLYYLGDGLGDPLSTFQGTWLLSPTGAIDWGDSSQKVDYTRFVGGLKGDFGGLLEGWDWDVFAQYSKSSGDYTNQRLLTDALDAQTRIGGPGSECEGSILPVSGRVCHDFNFEDPDFLQGVWTQQARDLFLDTETGHTDYTQKFIEGTVSGDLFNLPAGPVGAALGFHVREDEIEDVPGAITLAGNAFSASSAGITAGKDKIKEVFGELRVPLVKDQPFFEDLSFTGSGRHTSVDSSGEATTYKAGLNWQVTPAIRFRATKGTSFRAPALFELYLANETGAARLSSTDPCINVQTRFTNGEITQELYDNCLDPAGPGGGVGPALIGAGIDATVSSSGGYGMLTPEESEAQSLGVVLTPPGSNLSIAIDYFDIRVTDEVTKLGAGNIVLGCYLSDTFPADPLCSLFTRLGPPGNNANNLDTIINNFINIADQRNRGIDLTVRWTHDIGPGTLTANGQFTYQLQDSIVLLPDSPGVDTNGNVGDPQFVGNSEIRYDWDDWTVQWSMQFVGPSNDDNYCADSGNCHGSMGTPQSAFYAPNGYYSIVGTEFTTYHDLSVRKRVNDWSMLVGVSNMFDTDPPRLTDEGMGAGAYQNISGTGAFALSQYDLLGRRVFVNISKKF